MATTKTSRAKAAATSTVSSTNHHTKAPFGFVFLFLLLTATFMFSTFFVVSQTAREEAVRNEALTHSIAVSHRVDALQAQVAILSAQLSALSPSAPLSPTSTANTLPAAKPAK